MNMDLKSGYPYWAVKNGHQVSSRGRLHRDIVEAYRNAKKR